MGTERDEANVTHAAYRRPRAIFLCLAALVACCTRGPRTTPPTFEEYPVAVYTGPVASLVGPRPGRCEGSVAVCTRAADPLPAAPRWTGSPATA